MDEDWRGYVKKRLGVGCFCVAAVLAAAPSREGPGLTVTFVTHAGFLFAAGDGKILVDALTEPSTQWPYQAPSPELRQKMERGEPPFDHVRLLLISHNHVDHHCPASTVRFLEQNPKAVVVTTPEVRAQMKKDSPEFGKIEARVEAPELAWKQSAVREINGIRLEIARLKHGDDKEWACIVYAFLFEMGGKKVLYAVGTTGAFPEEYAELGWAKRGIDAAFLGPNLMVRRGSDGGPAVNDAGIRQVRELIGPKVTVMAHILPAWMPYLEKVLPELQGRLPGLTLFRQPLESRVF
jgi:L-ascorbate metabolism protein UlaG (beta-lactamase superfamily)